MSDEIDLLNKQANLLKMQIQEIISNDNDNEELTMKKLGKIKELEVISTRLAEQEKRRRNQEEYNKVCRITTSLEYSRLKNKPNRNELVNEMKEKREKAKQEFETFKDIEAKYNENDPEEVPGYIFFSTDVVNKYGLCPFISHDSIHGDKLDKDVLKQNRLNWLENQQDQGGIYRQLFEKLEKHKIYKECVEKNVGYEMYFDEFQANTLTEMQQTIFEGTISLLNEYLQSKVKTKKVKDQFKIVINNLSILVNETGLQINKYISLRYNVQIPVNVSAKIEDVSRELKYMALSYNDKLLEYEKNKEEMVTSLKFVNNMKKNLKLSLYEHLQEESKKEVVISQEGKYFKKWSDLTQDEKLERFYSFSVYFTYKYLLQPNLIKECDVETQIQNLKELLKRGVDDKSIKFKNLKWNVKRGIIERISILKWDDSKGVTYLLEQTPVLQTSQLDTKKASSVKSVINKSTEKVINEQIVVFILSRFDNNLTVQELKDQCIEQIKLRLKLKRVLKNDKVEILKKFNDIYQVISNNKNDHNN